MTVNYSVCGNCDHPARRHGPKCGVRGCGCTSFKPKQTS